MNLQKEKFSYFILFLISLIFISLWFWARAILSISFIIITLIYLYSNRSSFLSSIKENLYQNPSFAFLLFAGVLYSVNCIYLSIINQEIHTIELLFVLANPLIVTLYTFALIHLLSKNENHAKYLINVFCIIISFIAILSFFVFIFYYLKGQNFLIRDFYSNADHAGQSQNLVALTFPFTAVLLLNKVPDIKKVSYKIFIIAIALIIIFADVFINQSKIGYIIELTVLVYYCYYIIKKYSYINKKLFIRKFLLVLVLVIFSLGGSLYITYKTSTIFHQRVSTGISGFNKFFNKNNSKTIEGSVEIRLTYYSNSIKIFKKYPKILLFGCPINESTISPWVCTGNIINKDLQLQKDMKGLKDIPPHNEFINYTYQSGIFASLSLLIFLILIFYEAKHINKEYIVSMRVLIMAFFVGCCFEFYMTRQMNLSVFFTLLGIFLSTKNNKALNHKNS